jgi:hypothetical protein
LQIHRPARRFLAPLLQYATGAVELTAEDASMKLRKHPVGTIVLSFFGFFFLLLLIGTVVIVEDAERSGAIDAGFFPESPFGNSTNRDSENVSRAPRMNLPNDFDKKETPNPRDFLIDPLPGDIQLVPDRR